MIETRNSRLGVLERMRALKMARSTHAYVLANTLKFYEWLAQSRSVQHLAKGPRIWIFGDCHLGNPGPVANADGGAHLQIRT